MNKRYLGPLGVMALALSLFLNASAATVRMTDSGMQVAHCIKKVRLARGANEQTEAAEALRNVVLAANAHDIDDETIHAIASLLDTRHDAVRYWVAEALGHFGSRARFAAPKLLEILKERECVIAETSSVSMIRLTLANIGTPAPPVKCDYYTVPK